MQEVVCTTGGNPQAKVTSTIREYGKSIVFALILALIIRTFVIQPFKIPSGSMEDTLLIGDHILVNKFIYGIRIPFTAVRLFDFQAPRRGDVVVFRFPENRSQDFIKRVIGAPGDEIQVKDKEVYVNGAPYFNPHAVHKDPTLIPAGVNPRDNFGPVRVPAHEYFMMGDNRDRSYDSRFWGFVKSSDIEGKAVLKHWSWDHDAHSVRWERLGRSIE